MVGASLLDGLEICDMISIHILSNYDRTWAAFAFATDTNTFKISNPKIKILIILVVLVG